MKDEKILSNEELLEITGGKGWVLKPIKPGNSFPILKYGIPVTEPEYPVMALYAIYPDLEEK